MTKDSILIDEMIEYFRGDAKRIQHFIKVYTFATLIGEKEKLNETDMPALRAAAIVHDIGIKIGEEKFGRCDGEIQEQLGPDEAEKLLRRAGYSDEIIERVKYMVAHHHSCPQDAKKDLRILAEADYIVNAYEENLPKERIMFGGYKIFRTVSGKKILKNMFNL